MPSFKVFLSYKEEDGEAAEELQASLLEFAKDYLKLQPRVRKDDKDYFDVFLARSRSSIADGDIWRSNILERLGECDVFLLLYTTPNTDWSWCLYEAGIFAGTMQAAGLSAPERQRRILCVHAPPEDAPRPRQLADRQATPAAADKVRELIEDQIIERVGLANAPDANYSERLDEVVAKVLAVFAPYERLPDLDLFSPRPLLPRITIRGPLCHLSDVDAFLKKARVVFDCDANTIFGFPARARPTFPAFEKRVGRATWFGLMRASIAKLFEGPNVVPATRVILDIPQRGGLPRLCRPVFTDVRSVANALEFDISFVELVGDMDIYQPELNRTFKLLRIAHSFRVSVIERLKSLQAAYSVPPGTRLEIARDIQNILARYEQFGIPIGPDPLEKMNAAERDLLRAHGEKFVAAVAELLASVETGKPPAREMSVIVKEIETANMAWLEGVANLYLRQVALLAKDLRPIRSEPASDQSKQVLRLAVVCNGNAEYTQAVLDGFLKRTRALLAGTDYSPQFEVAEGFAEASMTERNGEILKQLLARFGDAAPHYLVTIGTQVSQFAREHYLGRIPLIFIAVTDPVYSKLVPRLEPDAQRGAICGVTYGLSAASRLSFIAEAFPGKRLGFIYNPDFQHDIAMREQLMSLVAGMKPPVCLVPIKVTDAALSDEQLGSADVFFGWDYLDRQFARFTGRYDKPFIALRASDGLHSAVASVNCTDDQDLGALAAERILKPNLLDKTPLHAIPIEAPDAPAFAINRAVLRRFGLAVSDAVERRAKVLFDGRPVTDADVP